MIQKVLQQKGFWKSVIVLGCIYSLVFWVIIGFTKGFVSEIFTPKNILMVIIAGFIVALTTTYGKFWRKLKEDEYRKP